MKTRVELIERIIERLDTLSHLLKIQPSTPLQPTDHASLILNEYQQKEGFSKFFYYLQNRRIIKGATEFNQLVDLINHIEALPPRKEPQIEGVDKALLDHFFKKPRGGDFLSTIQIILADLNFSYNTEFKKLEAELQINQSESIKWAGINQFLTQVQFALTFSNHARGKILARFMDKTFQQYNQTYPELKFASSKEIKQTLGSIPSLLDPNLLPPRAEVEQLQLSSTWYCLGFIPITTLSSVEKSIQGYQLTLHHILQAEDRGYQSRLRQLRDPLQLAINQAHMAFSEFFEAFFARCLQHIKKSQQAYMTPDFRTRETVTPSTSPINISGSWFGWLWGSNKTAHSVTIATPETNSSHTPDLF